MQKLSIQNIPKMIYVCNLLNGIFCVCKTIGYLIRSQSVNQQALKLKPTF